MTVFNKGFYPTPRSLADKAVAMFSFKNCPHPYVLDPEAGKGDLLDAVAKHHRFDHYHKPNLYAIEIEPDLISILEGKGYPVIGRDFLEYTPTIHFTHVIMNPPFLQCERHLIHAWNILYEGQIACILPKRVLEAKDATEITVCRLIEDYGQVHEVGRAYAHDAEQRMDDELIIVKLTKTANGSKLEWEVENDRAEPEFDDGPGGELALNGFVANLVSHYNASLDHYAEYNRARQQILMYAAPFQGVYSEDGDSKYERVNVVGSADRLGSPNARYNRFAELLTAAAWMKILDHPGFQSMLTKRAREMMAEFRARQRRVDFNEQNIKHMFEAVLAKKDELLMAAILDAFDNLTKYHEFNRVHVEGWKSNLAWMVARRVVFPFGVRFSFGSFSVNYNEELNDIDRALCVIAQVPYEKIQTVEGALQQQFQKDNKRGGVKLESSFFEIRFYKKGTLHLFFKDEALWQKFNLTAARGRNWLPPGVDGFAVAGTETVKPERYYGDPFKVDVVQLKIGNQPWLPSSTPTAANAVPMQSQLLEA